VIIFGTRNGGGFEDRLYSIFLKIEMVSRLKVNLYKSKLYGMNIKDSFMDVTVLIFESFSRSQLEESINLISIW
jgi:hypothetical protein